MVLYGSRGFLGCSGISVWFDEVFDVPVAATAQIAVEKHATFGIREKAEDDGCLVVCASFRARVRAPRIVGEGYGVTGSE